MPTSVASGVKGYPPTISFPPLPTLVALAADEMSSLLLTFSLLCALLKLGYGMARRSTLAIMVRDNSGTAAFTSFSFVDVGLDEGDAPPLSSRSRGSLLPALSPSRSSRSLSRGRRFLAEPKSSSLSPLTALDLDGFDLCLRGRSGSRSRSRSRSRSLSSRPLSLSVSLSRSLSRSRSRRSFLLLGLLLRVRSRSSTSASPRSLDDGMMRKGRSHSPGHNRVPVGSF
jgi:hypothetical protein